MSNVTEFSCSRYIELNGSCVGKVGGCLDVLTSSERGKAAKRSEGAIWSSANVRFSSGLSVLIWFPVLDPKLLDPVKRQLLSRGPGGVGMGVGAGPGGASLAPAWAASG